MTSENDTPQPKRRKPVEVGGRARAYSSYDDVRGDAAKEISVAMGVEEQSSIARTGHLIEIRGSTDHTRISAHGTSHSREVMVYPDHSVITLDLYPAKEEAIQTVYSPNGDIEILKAGWSYQQNGYHGPYEKVSLTSGNEEECKAQADKYEKLIDQAVKKAVETEPAYRRR